MMFRYLVIICSLVFIILNFSCKKDIEFSSDSSLKLDYSTDTISLDTIFTTIGSVTSQLKIYNRNQQNILIDKIELIYNQQNIFRINLDGKKGRSFNNIEILSGDSLFVFIEATIDPNNKNIPVVVYESLSIKYNSNIDFVSLEVWGRDAYFHTPTDTLFFNDGSYFPFSYANCKNTWPNDKPHVIYGITVVDEDSILNIQAGTEIYMHSGSVLWVYDGGSLKIKGSLDNPVVIKGDRTDYYYKDRSGQWDRIWLSAGSKENIIEFAEIRNGNVGIHIDTLSSFSIPTLSIKNTIIDNMQSIGLLAQGSYINAENLLISNCGQNLLALKLGGYYNFTHCTFANYWNNSFRNTPSVLLNDYYEDVYGNINIRPIENASFNNCIIFGNLESELGIDLLYNDSLHYLFNNCILKINNDFNYNDTNIFKNLIVNPSNININGISHDPIFLNPLNNDFNLFEQSVATNKGSLTFGFLVPNDFNGNSRIIDSAPDIGVYEYVP